MHDSLRSALGTVELPVNIVGVYCIEYSCSNPVCSAARSTCMLLNSNTQNSQARKMKITKVETIVVSMPMIIEGSVMPKQGGKPRTSMDTLLVKIETDEGVTGWGEGF